MGADENFKVVVDQRRLTEQDRLIARLEDEVKELRQLIEQVKDDVRDM